MFRDEKGGHVPGVGGAGGEPAEAGGNVQTRGRTAQVNTANDLFNETINHTQDWLREICCDLGSFDLRDGYHAMRAVFSVLREHLPIEETAHFSAQLPVLVRGVFFDGWRPTHHVRARSVEEFEARVRDALAGTRPVDAHKACQAVLGAICRHVTRGELEDVRACLPGTVKDLISVPAAV
jgi:uncharacterized protein (DUF2267 family)